MADIEYGGDDLGDYFFEDDWLYIEDEVAFADELAETQVPSPGYSGVNADLLAEWYEYDTYEYFGELEYGSDSYWDTTIAKTENGQEQAQSGGQSPRKRKREWSSISTQIEKRRKVDGQHQPAAYGLNVAVESVVYRTVDQPIKKAPSLPPQASTFALLPDWRERFPADAPVVWKSTMPEDMERAAQTAADGADVDVVETAAVSMDESSVAQPLRKSRKRKAVRSDILEEESSEPSTQDLLSSLDPEALRAILRSQLGDGMNEEAFMKVIGNMLAGGESADEAVAQLASTLLGQGAESSEATLGWLEGRGVNIADASAEDDEPAEPRVDSAAGSSGEAAQAMSGLDLEDAIGDEQLTTNDSHGKRKSQQTPGRRTRSRR